MGEIFKAALLGIVEGITEFLPISSTGHLILVNEVIRLSGDKAFVNTLEVVIQLGAIFAVVWLYWSDLFPFGVSREKQASIWRTWLLVIVGTLPAFVLGFLFDDWIDAHLFNSWVVGTALLGYGVVLLLAEWWGKERFAKGESLDALSLQKAVGIGIFQCLALVPGTSRSLATILGGLLLGLSRESAARFSFFLAIPIMFGASALKLVKYTQWTASEVVVLGVGFVVSFVVAWMAITFLMRYIQKHTFVLFGYYRIVVGIAVLLILGMGK